MVHFMALVVDSVEEIDDAIGGIVEDLTEELC